MVIRLSILFILTCGNILFANPFVGGKGITAGPVGQNTTPFLIRYQQELRAAMAQGILQLKQSLTPTGVGILILVSFLYGMAHAAGPGHRKGIVFAYFLTKRAAALEPLLVGIGLAAEHIVSSILLVLGIKFFVGHFFHATGTASALLENTAYATLAVLGLLLIVLKIRDLYRDHHDEDLRNKQKLATLFVSGLIPCPAATLILVFCTLHKVFWLGLVSVIAMSVGIAVVGTAVGYLAAFGQRQLPAIAGDTQTQQRIGDALEFLGLILFVTFSLYMLLPVLLTLQTK